MRALLTTITALKCTIHIETKQFVEAENKVTQSFIEGSGKWHKINEKLTTLYNYPKYSLPERHGNYYYTSENTGLQNQE